jgi:hypothetical protein
MKKSPRLLFLVGAGFILLPHFIMMVEVLKFKRAAEGWMLPTVLLCGVGDLIGFLFLVWAVTRIFLSQGDTKLG